MASSSEQEINGLPQTSSASAITFDQKVEEEEEEEEEKVEEDSKHEKEVKSILKTDRNEGDPGYKAVWFKTDVDPSGENVEVINDDAADYDDDSDQDLQENEKEEEDDRDDHYRGLGMSLASGSSSVSVNMSTRDDSDA